MDQPIQPGSPRRVTPLISAVAAHVSALSWERLSGAVRHRAPLVVLGPAGLRHGGAAARGPRRVGAVDGGGRRGRAVDRVGNRCPPARRARRPGERRGRAPCRDGRREPEGQRARRGHRDSRHAGCRRAGGGRRPRRARGDRRRLRRGRGVRAAGRSGHDRPSAPRAEHGRVPRRRGRRGARRGGRHADHRRLALPGGDLHAARPVRSVHPGCARQGSLRGLAGVRRRHLGRARPGGPGRPGRRVRVSSRRGGQLPAPPRRWTRSSDPTPRSCCTCSSRRTPPAGRSSRR